ncbi:MAG: hypothetical protein ACLPX1_20570 [Steroidobacteraceae bacterium]
MNTRWKLSARRHALIGALAWSSATFLPFLGAPGAAFADAPSPAPAPARVAASWQKHQYSFQYVGFTSTYSCDGLADKLKLLLLAAGARPDVKSQPGACASPYGRPDKFARADLTFYTLQPLDGGTVKDLGAASDVRAASTPPPAAAQAKPLDAIWRPVVFAAFSPQQLRVGDCELVDQFRHDVLPMFATRNLENGVTCIPHQESGSVINLKFESLKAVPASAAQSH